MPGAIFDKMVQDAHVWLQEIADRMDVPENRKIAYHALRGVFFALRDRLTVNETFDLSAQLPTLIRGIFFEGYQPEHKPEKYDREEFLEVVEQELDMAGGADPELAAKTVMEVLSEHISPGEARHIREVLPMQLRTLWNEPVFEEAGRFA